MTSDQTTKDKLIYDDYVRFCGDIQVAINSVVGRSQTLLSLSVAAVVGYFVVSGRAIGEASVLELIGISLFILGILPFFWLAFPMKNYRNPRLRWELRFTSSSNISRVALISIVQFAQRISAILKSRETVFKWALRIWAGLLIACIIFLSIRCSSWLTVMPSNFKIFLVYWQYIDIRIIG